jgi:hypothetical protein
MNSKTTPTEVLPPADTVNLPAPKRGFMYVQVPEDLRATSFDLPALYSLCRLEGGGIVEDLDHHITKVVSRAMTMQKKGTVSLVITLKPEGIKNMEITAKVDSKPPKMEPTATMLFATPNGQLLAHDPEQMLLGLKVVDSGLGGDRRIRRFEDD